MKIAAVFAVADATVACHCRHVVTIEGTAWVGVLDGWCGRDQRRRPDVCAVCSGCPAGCLRCIVHSRRICTPCVRTGCARAGRSRRLFAQGVVQDDGLRRMFADCAVCVLYHVHAFAPYARAVCVAPDVCAVCFACSTPMN